VSPTSRDWVLVGGILLVAFVVGGVAFGTVTEILVTCSMRMCPPERYIATNIGAGMAASALVAIALLAFGAPHRR
jgi:hypothetical protein